MNFGTRLRRTRRTVSPSNFLVYSRFAGERLRVHLFPLSPFPGGTTTFANRPPFPNANRPVTILAGSNALRSSASFAFIPSFPRVLSLLINRDRAQRGTGRGDKGTEPSRYRGGKIAREARNAREPSRVKKSARSERREIYARPSGRRDARTTA